MTERREVTQRSVRYELAFVEMHNHATHEVTSSQHAWIALTFIDDQVMACLHFDTHRHGEVADYGPNNIEPEIE